MKIRLRITDYGLRILLVAIFLLPWGARWIIKPGAINEYGTISLYVGEVLILLVSVLSFRSTIFKTIGIGAGILGVGLMLHSTNIGWLIHITIASIFAVLLWVYREHRAQFLKVFVASALAQSLFGLIQVIIQRVPVSKWLGTALQLPETLGASVAMYHGERFLRAYGTLPHPNVFGAYAVVGFFCALILMIKDQARKYLWLAAALICSIGTMISFSRAAWISFVLVMVLVSTSRTWEKTSRSLTAGIVILAIIFISIFHYTLTTRIVPSGPLEARSINERVSSIHEALQLMKRHPILGIGGGNYTRAVHDELDPARSSWAYQPVHNVPLLLLAELGSLGFLVVLMLVWKFRKRVWVPLTILLPFLLFDHFLWTLAPGIFLFVFSVQFLPLDTKRDLV